MTVQFRPNLAGYRELLLSAGVAADLERRAERVQAAAANDPSWDQAVSGIPGDEAVPYRVRVERHRDRNVAQVVGEHPAALNVEAKHRVLGRAIDHAR